MSSAKRKWIAGFYWIGVARRRPVSLSSWSGTRSASACLSASIFRLSWAFAGIAGIAFLAAELCHSIACRPRSEKRPSQIPRAMAAKSKS